MYLKGEDFIKYFEGDGLFQVHIYIFTNKTKDN